MSFTSCTITHSFKNADGTPASGTVTFQLTKRMSQSGESFVPGEVTSTLDSSGNLSQTLTANNDPGTTPADAQWVVYFRMQGSSVDGPWNITVPTGGGTVDLYTLLPQTTIGNA